MIGKSCYWEIYENGSSETLAVNFITVTKRKRLLLSSKSRIFIGLRV